MGRLRVHYTTSRLVTNEYYTFSVSCVPLILDQEYYA